MIIMTIVSGNVCRLFGEELLPEPLMIIYEAILSYQIVAKNEPVQFVYSI